MNIFRFVGDMSHLLSFFILLYRLHKSRNANGISLKTQELYFLVFVTRYLDLFTTYYSLYNTCMKLVYLAASGAIVYKIRFTEPFKTSYDREANDKFPHIKWGVLPCLAIALFVNEGHFNFAHLPSYFMEVAWAFSLYLEAMAIIPQLVVLQSDKLVENLTSHYMAALGAYRALYLLNWIYRYFTEPYYRAWLAWGAGIVQTAFYCDFFYYYVMSKYRGMQHTPLPQ